MLVKQSHMQVQKYGKLNVGLSFDVHAMVRIIMNRLLCSGNSG